MNLEAIKKILETPEGQELKEYLQIEVLKLGSIAAIKKLDDPAELALEVKAQAKAYEALIHILEPLLDIPKLPIVKSKGHELIPE
jgi:hypothetical protein